MSDKVVISTVAELKTWIGKEVAVGKWITVTQDLIDKFAEASGDFQWIHVDVERCKKESPFKTPIAHGNLTFCLLSSIARNADVELPHSKMGINYGGQQDSLYRRGSGRVENPRTLQVARREGCRRQDHPADVGRHRRARRP